MKRVWGILIVILTTGPAVGENAKVAVTLSSPGFTRCVFQRAPGEDEAAAFARCAGQVGLNASVEPIRCAQGRRLAFGRVETDSFVAGLRRFCLVDVATTELRGCWVDRGEEMPEHARALAELQCEL